MVVHHTLDLQYLINVPRADRPLIGLIRWICWSIEFESNPLASGCFYRDLCGVECAALVGLISPPWINKFSIPFEVVFDFHDRCGWVFQKSADLVKLEIFGYAIPNDVADQVIKGFLIGLLLSIVGILLMGGECGPRISPKEL